MKNMVQGVLGIMLCSQMSRTMEILGMFCLLWAMPDAINASFWNRLWLGQDRGIEIVHPTQNFWKLFCSFVDQQGHWAVCVCVCPQAGLLSKVYHFVIYPGHSWTLLDGLCLGFFGFAFTQKCGGLLRWSPTKLWLEQEIISACRSLNLLEEKEGFVQ